MTTLANIKVVNADANFNELCFSLIEKLPNFWFFLTKPVDFQVVGNIFHSLICVEIIVKLLETSENCKLTRSPEKSEIF